MNDVNQHSFMAQKQSPALADLGLTPESVFTDSRIRVWRSLPDRENATLDLSTSDGRPRRFHIKRYPSHAGQMADKEWSGFQLLRDANIPAAPIIAHGHRPDGSAFIILPDLAGYTPADKLLEKLFPFDQLLTATADLTAQLHRSRLHHRDLYLCHFMINPANNSVDAKLIDMARVARMTNPLTRRRWIVKDLGQFWYSTLSLLVTEDQRLAWLNRYCEKTETSPTRWLPAVRRRAASIARHDKSLRQAQPTRNISIEH